MLPSTDYLKLPHASRVLFESEVVQIGATRCPAWHAAFENPGPIQRHAIYLGGTPVRVLRDGQPSFVADSTTVSFHHRGEEPQRRQVGHGGDYSNWLAVAPDYLWSALDPDRPPAPGREPGPFRVTHGPCPASGFALQRALVAELEANPVPDPLLAEEVALQLTVELVRSAEKAQGRRAQGRRPRSTRARHATLIDRVKDHLACTYRETQGLPELARHVGASPYHLARIFRSGTGWSLHGYRTQLRLRAALDAVLGGHCDLEALARELGFSSHSHLTSSFRRTFGLAPSKLRGAPRQVVRELVRLGRGPRP